MNVEIPACVRRLFWDVRPETVEVTRHGKWLIKRILDWGDAESINWLRATYSEEEIKRVVIAKRGLARKTWVFWMTYFGLLEGIRG